MSSQAAKDKVVVKQRQLDARIADEQLYTGWLGKLEHRPLNGAAREIMSHTSILQTS
jgi:hypothetical protein